MKKAFAIPSFFLLLIFAIPFSSSRANPKQASAYVTDYKSNEYKIKDTVTIGDNLFLFAEKGGMIDQYLEIWMVKSNKNSIDTNSIYTTTLHEYDGFETDYSATSSEYDVIGDKFILYTHHIYTNYTLESGTTTESYTTREIFVIQKQGKVVRLECRYGMVDERIVDHVLDDTIRARTDHYFPFGSE